MIVHKLNQHKTIERRTKTSDIITNSYHTEDTIYSSDSECEYRVITRIELKRIPRHKSEIKDEDNEPLLASPINDRSWDDEIEPNQIKDEIKCEPLTAAVDYDKLFAAHKLQPTEFQCVYCRNAYKNQGSVRSHMFLAHKGGNAVAPLKNKEKIASLSDKSIGKNSGKVGRPLTIKDNRSFKCKHCNEIFANRSNYNKHVLTLRNGKPFFCRACITGFDFRGDLIQHKRQHRECKSPPREKKYLCTYCGKYFEKKDSLRQHTRVHTKERPFQCINCKRTFVNKGTLKDHMNSHSGLKPYICPILDCGKAFRLACTLKQHKMNVHEPPTFKCSFCAKMFSDKKHME